MNTEENASEVTRQVHFRRNGAGVWFGDRMFAHFRMNEMVSYPHALYLYSFICLSNSQKTNFFFTGLCSFFPTYTGSHGPDIEKRKFTCKSKFST